MQQFIVPQFIDVEPKIFGPITVRQFILLVVGGVLIFLAFKFANTLMFLLVTVLVGGLVALFGFLKVNGLPFHIFLINFLTALRKPRLRVWRKIVSETEIKLSMLAPKEKKEIDDLVQKPMVPSSKLAELSLIVDTHGQYKGEE